VIVSQSYEYLSLLFIVFLIIYVLTLHQLVSEPSLFPGHQSQGEGVTALHTRRSGMIVKNQLEKNHRSDDPLN
jgi:hypothetical protein